MDNGQCTMDNVRLILFLLISGLLFPDVVFGIIDAEKTAVKAIRADDTTGLRIYMASHPGPNCEFSNGKTGLYYAIVYDAINSAEFLLAGGADPDDIVDGNSLLKWAIKYNRPRIIRFLIEYGAGINTPDDYGNTPLMYAASVNNLEICRLLVNRGADPMIKNPYERRASDFATAESETPLFRYLLFMERMIMEQDSLPDMLDGPYIFQENDRRITMKYYERSEEMDRTFISEKTITPVIQDTVVSGFGRDSNTYRITDSFDPDSCIIETTGDVFVIGDIHGRYQALVNLLINNKIIDDELNWRFGNGHLVLLGDVFDRGDKVTETLWFLYGLQFQARESGGNVHLLLGNHEIMAMTGDHRYLHEKYQFFMRYTSSYYDELYDENSLLGRWLRSRNVILQINGNLLVHAGISPELASTGLTYSQINSSVRDYLSSPKKVKKGSPEELIMGENGPLWFRGYMNAEGYPSVPYRFVGEYLQVMGLNRMIVGHNEQQYINTSFEGKVIFADVAIDATGKSSQGLLISGDEFYRCYSDGRRESMPL